LLHEQGRILERRYEEGGILLQVEAPRSVFEKVSKALREQEPAAQIEAERFVSGRTL